MHLHSVKDKNKNYIFYDIGTKSNYGIWEDSQFGGQLERGDDYTTLTPVDDWDIRDITVPNIDMCIEFDINSTFISDASFIRFISGTSYIGQLSPFQIGLTRGQWSHVKINRVGSTLNIITDGVTKSSITLSSNNIDGFRLIVKTIDCTNIKYKNFIIYQIQ